MSTDIQLPLNINLLQSFNIQQFRLLIARTQENNGSPKIFGLLTYLDMILGVKIIGGT